MKKIAILGIVIASTLGLHAQERLVGLQNNPILLDKSYAVDNGSITRSAPSILLPFIDDFAGKSPIPDQAKWEGKSVFINSNYAINMPTVGVATFDAIDSNGKLYDAAGAFAKPCDTLTSLEINLSYAPNDNVILSFAYQVGGVGDMPESGDSLTLQFLNSSNQWVNVWSASVIQQKSAIIERNHLKGTLDSLKSTDLSVTFFSAYVRIDQPDYLYDGFRFRFTNYASVAVNSFVPGRASNADHWHLDLVYLNRARIENENTLDVALALPLLPFSAKYESIPWRHLNTNSYNQLFGQQLTTTYHIKNLGLTPSSVGLNLKIIPAFGNGESLNFSGGQHNIPDIGNIREIPVVLPTYNFYNDNTDSAIFNVVSYIVTDNDPAPIKREFRYNDTTSYTYKFHDYYAYDDGTSENGYGLYGSGSASGRVGVKFQNYVEDSLRGVYIYFNQTVKNVNTSNKIKLAVWADDGGGKPGELLYLQDTVRPTISGEMNKFVAYKFSKAIPIKYNQTYFVGWMQTNEDFVNIGFDRNRNHRDKIFFYMNGSWQPSVYEGAIMLRPIFAAADSKFPPNPVLPPVKSSTSDKVTAVPNPANDHIKLHWKDTNTEPLTSKVELFDMRGRLVKTMQVKYGESLNVSNLQEGTYLIRVSNGSKVVETTKVLIKK